MNKKLWIFCAAMFALLGLVLLSACSKKQASNEQEEQSATPKATATIDPNTVGSVEGTIKFAGMAPKPVKIDMSQDPACKGTNTAEDLVVDSGNLANVFVYVKDGMDNYSFDTPKEPAKIDQEGCRYHPHVLGVMAGQTVEVVNDDPTTHNTHTTPKDNREWNES